ncbi:MAG: 3-methyl-2-oxobutanoate hydroxymethyltransferase [Hyphomicrobiaceae bacterium]
MSTHTTDTKPTRRLMPPDIRARKGGTPLVMVTSYLAPTARLADANCDMLLVGDSLGMVLYGAPSTLSVTLDDMIRHGRAVAAASTRALVVVDLPFASYEASPERAFESASRVLAETGAGAVKLEGGSAMASTIAFLSRRGVPVMAHVGLTPQAINTIGGFKIQGRGAGADTIAADAMAVADAGAFAVVLEAVPEPLAHRITTDIAVPTIGIGASAQCDGQVLVLEDLIGLTERTPKFVKRYADAGKVIGDAIAAYAAEVRSRAFPGDAHVYSAESPTGSASAGKPSGPRVP